MIDNMGEVGHGRVKVVRLGPGFKMEVAWHFIDQQVA